jgi:hypothetical protein
MKFKLVKILFSQHAKVSIPINYTDNLNPLFSKKPPIKITIKAVAKDLAIPPTPSEKKAGK